MRPGLVLPALVVFTACGSPERTPIQPTPPAPTNHAPVIASATITPAFGIQELTTFTFSAQASDPDGDAVTYRWELPSGAIHDTPSFTAVYKNGGDTDARVIVTDAKGDSASTRTNVIAIGTMTGLWRGSGPHIGDFTMNLVQAGAQVTGSIEHPALGSGTIDPAQPGSISPAGSVEMRIKVARRDLGFRGQMAPTGKSVEGRVDGGGFDHEPVTLTIDLELKAAAEGGRGHATACPRESRTGQLLTAVTTLWGVGGSACSSALRKPEAASIFSYCPKV